MKLEFSQEIFEKCSNIKSHENASRGMDRQMERNDESRSRFLQLRKHA